MHNLDRRVQLLLDEPRYRKVAQEAERRSVSVASVIRDAIDRMPTDADLRQSAIAELLAAEPMEVPSDPHDLRRELDAARQGR
jgi:hypothetical protein